MLQEAWEHRSFLEILASGPLGQCPAGVAGSHRTSVSVSEAPPRCLPRQLCPFASHQSPAGAPFVTPQQGLLSILQSNRPVTGARRSLVGFPFLPMICDLEGLFMSLLAIHVWCKSFACLRIRLFYSTRSGSSRQNSRARKRKKKKKKASRSERKR